MYFLGIHLDGSAALIRKKTGQSSPGIEWIKKFDVKQFDNLAPMLEGKPYQLVTGLSASNLILRTLKLQLKSKREVLAALPFQIEGLIPTPIDELLIKPILHKEEVTILATKKSALEEHLALCMTQGFDPDIVSCVPLALWRFACEFFKEKKELLLIHFGELEQTAIVIEGGQLKLSHSFSHLGPQELERTVAYLRKKSPLLTQALLTGEVSEASKTSLALHFELLDLPPQVQELGEHAVSLGLALDAIARDAHSLQFRQGSYISLKARAKRKKVLLRYFGVCAACFLLAFGGTQLSLKKEQKQILAELSESSLSAEEAIAAAEQKLIEERKALPVKSTLPKVSDLLAWLSTDPIFFPKEGKLSIDSVSYELVPDARKEAITRVRVELLVSFSAPSVGRFLREALQADQTFVDQKEELKWSGEHNRARLIFQLKGRG